MNMKISTIWSIITRSKWYRSITMVKHLTFYTTLKNHLLGNAKNAKKATVGLTPREMRFKEDAKLAM